MSTGANKDDTIVSKKRKKVLQGYIHPNKPEIKRFDFFTGGYSDTGDLRIIYSKEFVPIISPVSPPADGRGAWQLVMMGDPAQGPLSYNRIGMKYFLKYIKFKGHISIHLSLPFTLRYKLVLIKSDWTFTSADDLLSKCFSNSEPMTSSGDSYADIERYCRHNFYKTVKWAPGMSATKTSIMTVSSGTLSPPDYVPRPTKTSTLGSNPSWSYTLPDFLRYGSNSLEMQQCSYLPLNVSVQVNDNVEVNQTHFYLMLMTDHGVGVMYPNYSGSTQYFYRATTLFDHAVAKFNFFGISYFTDL